MVPVNAFKSPGGLGCCPFEGSGSVVVVDLLFSVTPIMGVCNCSMFCCTLLYVHASIAIILMGKRELVALLNLSSWCLVMVECPLPRDTMGLSAVCDCGISCDHTQLLFKGGGSSPNPWTPQAPPMLFRIHDHDNTA